MEAILNWVAHYGYFAILALLVLGIVGLPVPDEWLLTFTGYLVYRGDLKLAPAFAAAFGGSAIGITISYFLGRSVGLWLIEKYGPRFHLTKDRLDKAHAWFERAGRWTLTIGYFIPGVRHLTAYVAGASCLEYPVFAGFAYSGALLWSSAFITLGYVVGEHWQTAENKLHRGALALGILALVAAGAYYFWRKRRNAATRA